MFDLEQLKGLNYITISPLFRVLLPIVSAIIIAGLFILLRKRNSKIVKIVFASILAFLYLFRVVFWIIRAVKIGYTANNIYVKIFGLDYANLILLLTSVTLYIDAFCSKKYKIIEFFKQTIIGVGFAVGLFGLLSCNMIDQYDNLYHVLNIDYMLVRVILVFIPIYLVFTKDEVINLSKFWYSVAGLICLTSLCSTFAFLTSYNISEFLYSTTLKKIGISVESPWHLLINIFGFLLMIFVLYFIMYMIAKRLLKNTEKQKNDCLEFFDLYSFATKSICCLQGFLLIMVAYIITKGASIYVSLICLIPFVMTIFCILAIFEIEKQFEINDEHFFDPKNKAAKKFLTYLMIGNFIFGLSVVKQIKNERENIEDRKIREEKKRLKQLEKEKNEKENGQV